MIRGRKKEKSEDGRQRTRDKRYTGTKDAIGLGTGPLPVSKPGEDGTPGLLQDRRNGHGDSFKRRDVAMEYCASSLEDGVLILSEFAGAAAQLQRGALLVNPYDIENMADVIHQAFHMAEDERLLRMRKLRRAIRNRDIFRWVDSFLRAAIAKNLENFPLMEDYVPEKDVDRIA